MKFADPKNDVAFRKIFGNEAKKVILISFLNSVLGLEGDREIIEDSWRDPYWGQGANKDGENHLSKLWVEILKTCIKQPFYDTIYSVKL